MLTTKLLLLFVSLNFFLFSLLFLLVFIISLWLLFFIYVGCFIAHQKMVTSDIMWFTEDTFMLLKFWGKKKKKESSIQLNQWLPFNRCNIKKNKKHLLSLYPCKNYIPNCFVSSINNANDNIYNLLNGVEVRKWWGNGGG